MNYDALTPVVEFNTIAGFPVEYRDIEHPDVQNQMLNIVQEEYEELVEAFSTNNRTEVIDGAADVLVTVAGLLARMGVDPNEAMRRVNESNASKFCKDAFEAMESVRNYLADERYTDVHTQVIGDFYVIFGKKVGTDSYKILKGIDFQEPVLNNL